MFDIFKRKSTAPVVEPVPVKDERFEAWPKTKRLFRQVTVTEKIDGTNACIVFDDNGEMFAQSRNRVITTANDNAGFAAWAYKNQGELFTILGPGRHYGEWWGQGIGRKYDMGHKVFSTFNTAGWYRTGEDGLDSRSTRAATSGIHDQITVVPTLYGGVFSEEEIRRVAKDLFEGTSIAASRFGKTFDKPEGVCIYLREIDTVMKYTFDKNDQHKWEESA